MKANEIKKGGHYIARISGNIVKVRVDEIRETPAHRTVYDVTNFDTGRCTTFKSAAKFRHPLGGFAAVR